MLILMTLLAAVVTACEQSPEREGTVTPSSSPITGSAGPSGAPAPLALGQPASVGAFSFTPAAIQARAGAVYDDQGERMEGTGVQVAVTVEKLREPAVGGGDDAELVVPVARLVDARGEAAEMDQLLGLPPVQAQSDEFNARYVDSFQYASLLPVGTVTKSVLWFSLPEGFKPRTLTIDAGAGHQAVWRLD
jgi:hypothetical protein